MSADAEQTLCLRLSCTALELITMQPTEDKELFVGLLFVHHYATVTEQFKVQILIFSALAPFPALRRKEMLPELATDAGRMVTNGNAFYTVKHLLKIDMLLNCRCDGANSKRGPSYQPIPFIRASWFSACSSAAWQPFVDKWAGLCGPMFDDQAGNVEVTVRLY